MQKFTLMRLIICYDIGHLVHDSGEGTQFIDVGIGIASEEAVAAGALADPEASTDFPATGWLFRCRVLSQGFAADQPAAYYRTIERDLRAKRRLDNGNLYLSVTNTNDTGTSGSIIVAGITRALFLGS